MAKRSAPKTKIQVSAELAEVIGSDKPLLMTDLTKKVWAYIKKYELQDENDGRIIHADDLLAEVIGSKPVMMLQLGGKLRKHYEVIK
jgi:DNA topoisomerase-3